VRPDRNEREARKQIESNGKLRAGGGLRAGRPRSQQIPCSVPAITLDTGNFPMVSKYLL